MRQSALFASLLLLGIAVGSTAEAQQSHRTKGPLRLDVRPRSFLDPGNIVAPNSSVNPASGYGQGVSYVGSPPYQNMNDRFGAGSLPQAIGHAPFAGPSNPFGPIDYGLPLP